LADPLEFRDCALGIIEATSLKEKLRPPRRPRVDDAPGEPLKLTAPGRPDHLRIARAGDVKVPSVVGLADPAQRPRIVHGFANHELQAVELYAWALLAFPDAPAEFRREAFAILEEEQMHCRLYCSRLRAWGVALGDYPVTGYFWNKVGAYHSPLHFVCAMALTFENANLDHTMDSIRAARQAGDHRTAAVIEKVHADERKHVAFGWRWLGEFKSPGRSMWDAYCEAVQFPLRPALARGRCFHRGSREAAGLDADFVRRLEATERGA
jgi:uncharacterized ferritin-like protein (DUF455 family)